MELKIKIGCEVKLKERDWSVQQPRAEKEDKEHNFDGSEIGERENNFCETERVELQSRAVTGDRRVTVKLSRLEKKSLRRYWRSFDLGSTKNPKPTKQQMVKAVSDHFGSGQVDEFQTILHFIHSAKRLKSSEKLGPR